MFPKVGQVIFLYIENTLNGQVTEYRTRLADETELEFMLDMPVNVQTNESSYVPVGKEMRLEYITNSGNRYIFEATVTKLVKKNVPFIIISKPDPKNVSQVQRRNFFRIEIDVDLAILRSNQTRHVYRTDDIGGGGISFVAGPHDYFEKNEAVDCWILLPYKNGSNDHAHFKAEVVRVKEEERGYKIVMLRYLDILESERQRIIRFSFAKQIELKDKSINN